jgi:hypothetical protein
VSLPIWQCLKIGIMHRCIVAPQMQRAAFASAAAARSMRGCCQAGAMYRFTPAHRIWRPRDDGGGRALSTATPADGGDSASQRAPPKLSRDKNMLPPELYQYLLAHTREHPVSVCFG